MLDSRNKAPVRYERVNAETGEEVPWKEIVKAFEYKKGSYVVLEADDIQSAASENRESVEVEAFVDAADIGAEYFEKPYFLVPGKKAEKGYVLLRETLRRTGKVGIARVVIRTREYLSAVIPRQHALMLVLMRFRQELVDAEELVIPTQDARHYRISERELSMAQQLIESMTSAWRPEDYQDQFRDRLRKVIERRMKSKGALATIEAPEGEEAEAATNVVDFMSLLKKSIDTKKRTPAKEAAKAKPARRAAKKGKAVKKSSGRRRAS
jgi:DNA end-binding protein Ku